MVRKASGADQLASARELLRTAKTADELKKQNGSASKETKWVSFEFLFED
jgi:hypothetical protein